MAGNSHSRRWQRQGNSELKFSRDKTIQMALKTLETQYCRIRRSRYPSSTGLILVHLDSYGLSSVSGLKLVSLLGKLYTRLHRPPASRSLKTRKENEPGSHRKFPSCLLSSAHENRAEGSDVQTFLSGAMEPTELLLRDQVLQGPVFL